MTTTPTAKPLQNPTATLPSPHTPNAKPISKKWYKNYMVWVFVIGLPLGMVFTCIWFLFYSIKVEDPVVRDDWFMDGKTLYADVSKDKLAHDLGLGGVVNFAPKMADGSQLVTFDLAFPAKTSNQFAPPAKLMVEISHATQKNKDRDFVINQVSNATAANEQRYQGKVTLDPSMGKYYLIIHDPDNRWRLRAVTHLPTNRAISFKPLTSFDAKTTSAANAVKN